MKISVKHTTGAKRQVVAQMTSLGVIHLVTFSLTLGGYLTDTLSIPMPPELSPPRCGQGKHC
uniref:Uncharacterized protein n=1 Tax=Oryza rufipogon TaxID=4529 RepID=A0A0E0R6Z4_ORYRU